VASFLWKIYQLQYFKKFSHDTWWYHQRKKNNKSRHFKEKVIHVSITLLKHSPFMKEKITCNKAPSNYTTILMYIKDKEGALVMVLSLYIMM
jgi:hypothetical protein